MKNLRHVSLHMNVFDPCKKCHIYNLNIRQDIHVKKIEVKKLVLKLQHYQIKSVYNYAYMKR